MICLESRGVGYFESSSSELHLPPELISGVYALLLQNKSVPIAAQENKSHKRKSTRKKKTPKCGSQRKYVQKGNKSNEYLKKRG